ncbi:hypothetical protein ONE63_009591 [Megalurothrips usitatus]|uniref:ISXO2-like transposase domain-containing protein n=1 Tax=Megalurothrips usitatus TaxID=439358 RepID=A0AAV7XMN1_9NEOP|nr:hypothetical protein ONE63_009591 [Megalurothrips usitatus]
MTMWLLLQPPRQMHIMTELQIDRKTYTRWAKFCSSVCILWCKAQSTPLGGPNKIVEIDEAKFGKRKYHRGRMIEGQWIFGARERNSSKAFFIPVEKRDQNTLVNIIKENILPQSTIISDCWKAYNSLNAEGYTHLTVNHSKNFVDPTTSANTQTIERMWRDARGFIPRFGRKKSNFPGYLAEYQFKRIHDRPEERVHAFLIACKDSI